MKTCSACGARHELSFFNRDRRTADGLYPQCKTCSRAACKRSFRKYHEKHKALKRRWKAENPERHREISLQWQRDNPERHRESKRRWSVNNPHKTRAHSAAYQARKKRATPPWVDLKGLQFVYDICPKGYHVDHIHPLCGENFCGLNVPWNLQFLPAEVHYKKGRKLLLAEEGPANL